MEFSFLFQNGRFSQFFFIPFIFWRAEIKTRALLQFSTVGHQMHKVFQISASHEIIPTDCGVKILLLTLKNKPYY